MMTTTRRQILEPLWLEGRLWPIQSLLQPLPRIRQ